MDWRQCLAIAVLSWPLVCAVLDRKSTVLFESRNRRTLGAIGTEKNKRETWLRPARHRVLYPAQEADQ